MWNRLLNWFRRLMRMPEEVEPSNRGPVNQQQVVDQRQPERRQSKLATSYGPEPAALSRDLQDLTDYLAKILLPVHREAPVPLDTLDPAYIKEILPEAWLPAFLTHIATSNIRIRIPHRATTMTFDTAVDPTSDLFQFTDERELVLTIPPVLFENSDAFGSILSLELCRFLVQHNNIQYGLHYADNIRLPDITLHLLGLSDVFLHGYYHATTIWQQHSPRPFFSQLRYEQHRSIAHYVNHIELAKTTKKSMYALSEDEMEGQILTYYRRDHQLMQQEIKRYQRKHPNFTVKDIYEKMLYDLKRDYR